ncbi:MAG: hypothetical protein HYX39_14370 [Bacteroidetes bacterium]|nr:hypothetical protein [Bacteroidota bacterium]
MNKITTRTIEAHLDEAGILCVKIVEGAEIDLDDAVDNFLTIRQLRAGQRRLKLVDIRGCRKITKKAKAYSLKEDTPEKTIAKAVLVKSIIGKIINIFFMKRNKSKVPVKFFISEKKARKWLNSFVENK